MAVVSPWVARAPIPAPSAAPPRPPRIWLVESLEVEQDVSIAAQSRLQISFVNLFIPVPPPSVGLLGAATMDLPCRRRLHGWLGLDRMSGIPVLGDLRGRTTMLWALRRTDGCLDEEWLVADTPRHDPSTCGFRFILEVREPHTAVGIDADLHIGHPVSAKRVTHGVSELAGGPPPWRLDRFGRCDAGEGRLFSGRGYCRGVRHARFGRNVGLRGRDCCRSRREGERYDRRRRGCRRCERRFRSRWRRRNWLLCDRGD